MHSGIVRIMLGIVVALFAVAGKAEILWTGDFNDGTFANWWTESDNIQIWGTPPYGRPLQYGGQNSLHVGNGDLMWLTSDSDSDNFRSGPRLGRHALGLHVKSWAGGSVDARSTDTNTQGDWDGSNDTRRRTELRGMGVHYEKKLIPYMTTRWASASIFVPKDWDTQNGSGWGVTTWQWKPQRNNSSMSPPITIRIRNGYWEVLLRTNPNENPSNEGWTKHTFNPSITDSVHYPDAANATRMLANLNTGEWAHFVIQLRMDGRTSLEGGSGFLKLWMRHGDGEWIQVIDFFPTPEYGVLFKQSGDDALLGFHASLYMSNSQVLDLPGPGRTLYYDNVKIGSEQASFTEMSHDASSFEQELSPPRPPPVEVE